MLLTGDAMVSHTKEKKPSDEPELKQLQGSPVRTAVRFPIQLPLRLQTPHGEVAAVTENISGNGLMFIVDEVLEIDTPIEFTMAMPAEVLGADRDVVVHCMGRIVRYQQLEPQIRAGAVIDEYFFKA